MEAIGGPEAGLYGELTPLGFRALIARLRLGADDTFVDCGSGLSRLVMQAASEFDVHHSIGVEFAASRHELAEELLSRQPAELAARVALIRADCVRRGSGRTPSAHCIKRVAHDRVRACDVRRATPRYGRRAVHSMA